MANSVDPHETAPSSKEVWSGYALFAQIRLYENLGSLRHVLNAFKDSNNATCCNLMFHCEACERLVPK